MKKRSKGKLLTDELTYAIQINALDIAGTVYCVFEHSRIFDLEMQPVALALMTREEAGAIRDRLNEVIEAMPS